MSASHCPQCSGGLYCPGIPDRTPAGPGGAGDALEPIELTLKDTHPCHHPNCDTGDMVTHQEHGPTPDGIPGDVRTFLYWRRRAHALETAIRREHLHFLHPTPFESCQHRLCADSRKTYDR